RETDKCEITQVELRYDLVQVFGESVVVVADRWLAGLAEPSAVVGDDTVTRRQQDRGLLLPGTAAQRIPVDQDYRLTGTVILIVEIDVARIFLTDINVWHRELSLFLFDVNGYRLHSKSGRSFAGLPATCLYRDRG